MNEPPRFRFKQRPSFRFKQPVEKKPEPTKIVITITIEIVPDV